MLRAPIWNMSAYSLDQLDLPRVHDLGDDRHAVLVADVAQDLAGPPRRVPGSCTGWCAA